MDVRARDVLRPPTPEEKAFEIRRQATQQAMQILAAYQPKDLPISPYSVIFLAQYLETGRMPPVADEDDSPIWTADKIEVHSDEESK